jgi:hypothetical protein
MGEDLELKGSLGRCAFEGSVLCGKVDWAHMNTKHAAFLFKIFVLFIFILVAEYVLSGMYFRLVRHSDFILVNMLSVVAGIGVGYWLLRKLIPLALKEQVPRWVIAVVLSVFCFLLVCFFRFSIQLTNGALDFAPAETQIVTLTGKNISALGGSFRDGPSPMAHLVYFGDWNNEGGTCELLITPAIYYTAGPGSRMEISVRKGLFNIPWVDDFQIVGSLQDRYQLPGN